MVKQPDLASLNYEKISERANTMLEEIAAQRTKETPALTYYTRDALFALIHAEERHFLEDKDYKIPLHNVCFSGSDLRGINFSLFSFNSVYFSGARIGRKELESLIPHAQQKTVSLRGINSQGADFSGKILNRSDIGIVKLTRIFLEGLDLRDANFKNANLDYIDLDGANLTGANFEGSSLKKALLRNCILINADMLGVNLTEAQLEGSDLRGADLRNANITDANFTGVKL